MSQKRVAIACQGGGSQCAFVAGALKALFSQGVQHSHRIVGLSGTSGGAITAALAWFGLLKQAQGDPTPVEERVIAFWDELSAQKPIERFVDQFGIQVVRLIESGMLPTLATSPASLRFRAWSKLTALLIGRAEFTDLEAIVRKHLDLTQTSSLVEEDSPVLLLGAADVCEGTFKIFSSAHDEISIPSLLASAAIPNLFPAVNVNGHAYWDGIFSSNPPVAAFLQQAAMGGHALPQEIWVVQVNQTKHGFVPERPSDITDRRNELAGNLSLHHELQLIEIVNQLILQHALTPVVRARLQVDAAEPIAVRFIRMSKELGESLDYPSKLSRHPTHIRNLIQDGERQASAFLAELSGARSPAEPAGHEEHGSVH